MENTNNFIQCCQCWVSCSRLQWCLKVPQWSMPCSGRGRALRTYWGIQIYTYMFKGWGWCPSWSLTRIKGHMAYNKHMISVLPSTLAEPASASNLRVICTWSSKYHLWWQRDQDGPIACSSLPNHLKMWMKDTGPPPQIFQAAPKERGMRSNKAFLWEPTTINAHFPTLCTVECLL